MTGKQFNFPFPFSAVGFTGRELCCRCIVRVSLTLAFIENPDRFGSKSSFRVYLFFQLFLVCASDFNVISIPINYAICQLIIHILWAFINKFMDILG